MREAAIWIENFRREAAQEMASANGPDRSARCSAILFEKLAPIISRLGVRNSVRTVKSGQDL